MLALEVVPCLVPGLSLNFIAVHIQVLHSAFLLKRFSPWSRCQDRESPHRRDARTPHRSIARTPPLDFPRDVQSTRSQEWVAWPLNASATRPAQPAWAFYCERSQSSQAAYRPLYRLPTETTG